MNDVSYVVEFDPNVEGNFDMEGAPQDPFLELRESVEMQYAQAEEQIENAVTDFIGFGGTRSELRTLIDGILTRI